MTGQVIHGKFEILDEIGHGGMGVVYRARQISLDRIVALKMLSANLVEDKEFRERFRQEAKIIARLTHPNIVHVYDVYDVEDKGEAFCIVMEFLEGRSLREILREAGSLPVERAVAITEQIASGLAYAHSKGIIHRDIKPDNIMMLSNDQVKIMDFGIAHLRGSTIQTQTGVSMGTPQFMSPEQAASRPVDARSDLYSCSVVLYGMVTGQLPFTADNPIQIALKHIQEPPRRPSQVNPAVPPALDSIILKGMAKRPENRYQSAEQMREALGHFRSATSVATSAGGDETLVTPPLSTPPAPQIVGPGPWDASAEASVIPSVPRRINWGWIVTALPGLIALAIVLYFVIYRPEWIRRQRGPAELREFWGGPFEKTLLQLRNMQVKEPDGFARFVEANEPFLRSKADEAIRREMKAGRLVQAHALRDEIEEIIFPYLQEKQQRLWPGVGSLSRPGIGPFGRRKESAERPELAALLNSQIIESATRDPDMAKQAFDKAKATEQSWESATSPTLRSSLLRRAFVSFRLSIYHDPKNWLYHWEFSQFLEKGAKEPDEVPGLRILLLQLAIDQITSATALCSDPAECQRMEKKANELRPFLSPVSPRKPQSPGFPGIRERMDRTEKP